MTDGHPKKLDFEPRLATPKKIFAASRAMDRAQQPDRGFARVKLVR